MLNDVIATYLPMAILIVGILAFVVSVIVEVTKNLPGLKGIPTDLEVIVLAIVLTMLAFFAYMSYMQLVITWYFVVGAIIAGFFVAFIAMYGWSKLTELYSRFKQ